MDTVNLLLEEFDKIDRTQWSNQAHSPQVFNIPLGGVVPVIPVVPAPPSAPLPPPVVEMEVVPEPDPVPPALFAAAFIPPPAASGHNTPEPQPSTSSKGLGLFSNQLGHAGGATQDEPKSKKARMEMYATTWGWRVVTRQGNALNNSHCNYLSKNGCQEEMNAAKEELEQEQGDEEEQLTCVMMPEEILVPSPSMLARRVYKYLAQFELEERVKKFCTGCIKKAKGEKAHSEGCKAKQETKVKMHGPSAANRISTSRLYECCMSISAYYTKGEYVSASEVQEVITSSKVVDLLLAPDEVQYESEYMYLKLI